MPTLPSSLALTSILDGSAIIASDHRNNYAAIQTDVNALITAFSGGTSKQFLQATSATDVAWAGGYTAYTPTWTATGVAPAIGNAVVVAQYLQIGKLVHAYGIITFGNTSTFGTGNYRFALPVTASANALSALLVGTGLMVDTSATAEGLARASLVTNATLQFAFGTTYLGVTSAAGQLTPWTWAQTDILAWDITYEAA